MWRLLRLLAGRPDFQRQIKGRLIAKDLDALRNPSSRFDVESPDQ